MKINVSNSFLLVVAFLIFANGLKLFSFVMLCCLIHELGHVFFMLSFGCNIKRIELSGFGFKIFCPSMRGLSKFKLISIYIGGILANFISSIVFYKVAISGFYSYNFFILSGISIYLLVFNMLPINGLDGGQILNILFEGFLSKQIYLLRYISLLFCVFLFIFGIILAKSGNLCILVVSIWLFISQKQLVIKSEI